MKKIISLILLSVSLTACIKNVPALNFPTPTTQTALQTVTPPMVILKQPQQAQPTGCPLVQMQPSEVIVGPALITVQFNGRSIETFIKAGHALTPNIGAVADFCAKSGPDNTKWLVVLGIIANYP